MDASRGRQRSERLRRLCGFKRVWLWWESLKHTPCSEEKDPTKQAEIDNIMIQQLDGTIDECGWCKQKLRTNAILAVSLAVCKVGAAMKKIPQYKMSPSRFTEETLQDYKKEVNMSIAILPMSAEYNWSPSTVGLIQSSFFWGYLLTQDSRFHASARAESSTSFSCKWILIAAVEYHFEKGYLLQLISRSICSVFPLLINLNLRLRRNSYPYWLDE